MRMRWIIKCDFGIADKEILGEGKQLRKLKSPLSRAFRVVIQRKSVNLNWCPEEDSNFHDLAVTST